jgi:hypothetical protein
MTKRKASKKSTRKPATKKKAVATKAVARKKAAPQVKEEVLAVPIVTPKELRYKHLSLAQISQNVPGRLVFRKEFPQDQKYWLTWGSQFDSDPIYGVEVVMPMKLRAEVVVKAEGPEGTISGLVQFEQKLASQKIFVVGRS